MFTEEEEEEESPPPKKPSPKKKKKAKKKVTRPTILKPSKNRNFASPNGKYNIDRGEGLSQQFQNLGLNDEEETNTMIVNFTYSWFEGELPNRQHGSNLLAKKRSTTDLLLFGPTSLKQISVSIVPPGDFVRVTILVPDVILSSSRNAVLVGSKQNGYFNSGEAMISSRITCAQFAISQYQAGFNGAEAHVEAMIRMPDPVYSQFCTRDDFGNKDQRPGVTVGIYDQPLQIPGIPPQYQFILHINTLPKQDVLAAISSPSEYLYSRAVTNQGQQWNNFQQYQQQHQQPPHQYQQHQNQNQYYGPPRPPQQNNPYAGYVPQNNPPPPPPGPGPNPAPVPAAPGPVPAPEPAPAAAANHNRGHSGGSGNPASNQRARTTNTLTNMFGFGGGP